MSESAGVVPDYVEDVGGEECFDTLLVAGDIRHPSFSNAAKIVLQQVHIKYLTVVGASAMKGCN